ncbi:AraC family transcriptional regulator [Paenibacillus ginsengarvi]|uniref:AraC family transcriptional regulator n=1 Tax=Paenibacillus ginsengarvi TaxID=400777 RepID=A0A3B0CN79_9BACL|nr:AraC family transcriptional regulator [Paenibacillus ginsengarvi]RKN86410.1 AraC family transcriptional regulator [Paenibacillus ginsengarvi]
MKTKLKVSEQKGRLSAMRFPRYEIREDILIRKLISCHYFELSKNYKYAGEKHDFWEIFYVDKGEIAIDTDFGHFNLKQGDLLFHEPNEFHSPKSNGKISPNVFIVTFECESEPMSFFLRNKLFHLNEKEKSVLAHMMEEGWNSFATPPLGSGRILSPRENAPFGCEQLFKVHLETLLIHLIRAGNEAQTVSPPPVPREGQESGLADRVIQYMNEHLGDNLTLDDLCDHFAIGRTQISIMFKKRVGCGVIEYMNTLKIDRAKTYIREDVFNLTEISELLGYSSVHYFSRHFKKSTGMTPSEYAKTLSGGYTRVTK